MTVDKKYFVIAAETLEARKRHRALIEQMLREMDLTPQQRADLQAELRQAVTKERAAQQDQEDAETAENDEKEKGEGGDSGKQGGAGGSSGGGPLGNDNELFVDGEGADIELVELLFFLAEMNPDPLVAVDQPADSYNVESSLAAATVLFNHHENIAQIQEPYHLAPGSADLHASAEFIPVLEAHAAQRGAHEMHVSVHPAAVAIFQNKFGYVAYGRTVSRSSNQMQRMRKTIAFAVTPKNNMN